jgi:hypothetical protein
MTLSQNAKQCTWLSSPLPDSLCDLVLFSTRKSSLRLPLVLAVAASPRLAHLLAGHAVHEQVCVMIPNYCHHTMAALHHLITTGATFSLNTRHMAELKEVCSLLGFGQVAREKEDGGRVPQAQDRVVCTSQSPTQLGPASTAVSVPSQHQPGPASVPGEGQDPLTTVTAGNDDLFLANNTGEVSKTSQPAVPSPSQGLATYPAPSTGLSAATSDGENVNCKEVLKEMNSMKSRLRSSAVAASKKLAETAGLKRKGKYSHHEKASRQQQAQCQSKKPDQPAPSITNSMLAEPVVQKQISLHNVRSNSSRLDVNSNDCRREKLKLRSKVVIGNHGKVLFKLRPRRVSVEYSVRRSPQFGKPESLEVLEEMNPSVPTTAAGCDSKFMISKEDQSVKSKESEGNFESTQDATLKCSTRKKRSTNSYTKLSCKKPRVNLPYFDIKTNNPIPPSQSMPSPSSTLSCPECLKSSPSQSSIYPNQTSYKQHLSKTHFLQKIINLFPGPDMVCHICTSSSKFPSKHLLAMHVGTAHSLCYSFVQEAFSCGICDQTFQRGSKFKMHLFAHYRSQLNDDFTEVIQCPFCSYWSTQHLVRHMGVHHGLVFKYYDPSSFMLRTPGNADKLGQDEGLVEVITLD